MATGQNGFSWAWCRALLVLGGIIAVACHGQRATRQDAPSPAGHRSEPRADRKVIPGPPVESLVITNVVPGEFSIRANTELELSTLAEIEVRSAEGQWSAYSDFDSGKGFRVVESCSSAPTACRRLSAGAQLNLAAWSGASCSAQCAAKCQVDKFHPGVHRLVLRACDNPTKRYEGAPFEMPASARELSRSRAAASMQRGTVFRLDPRGSVEGDAGQPPEYIARFRTVEGSARPLAPELLTALATWLRSKDGFVQYEVHKRCFQGHLVGLLLEGAERRAPPRTVEIALNLACNSAFISTTDGRGRSVEVSHFDPSWSEIISIVQRALPHDQELAGLKESPSNFPSRLDKPSP